MNTLLLQASSGSPAIMNIVTIGLVIVVFYFFMIRPQMKKQKEAKKFMENIKKGDKVVTIGGIHGKISEVNDSTFIIEVEGGNRLKISKAAVSMDNSVSLNTETK
ncbi:MAG: preprotein translocase subunit YajC [Bacteroidetes bacterium]|nr:preprotein translocase subunit YajC [Bacteroidota bacterium]